LRQTNFSASREPNQVTRFDQSGKPLGAGSTSYIVASARDDSPAASQLDLPIIVELWEFSYDPGDRLLRTSRKRTIRLVADDKRGDPAAETAPGTGAVPKL